MIAYPKTRGEFEYLKEFLAQRGEIFITEDSHILVWTRDGLPAWVVAMNGWVGQTCQMVFANARPGMLMPKSYIKALFHYAFNIIDRRYVFITVKGNNFNSLRLCLWLGFEEVNRANDAYKDGADLVLLTMMKANCRWIEASHERLSTHS